MTQQEKINSRLNELFSVIKCTQNIVEILRLMKNKIVNVYGQD
jgi:hypothetical protein